MNAPVISCGRNAERTMRANIAGMSPALVINTYVPARRYMVTMIGTSRPATAPIRLIPPMMTMPTRTANTMPATMLGMPKYSSVISPTFQAWNMLPPVTVDTSRVMQNSPPMNPPNGARPGFNRASPLLTTHMGPPWGLSGSSVLR